MTYEDDAAEAVSRVYRVSPEGAVRALARAAVHLSRFDRRLDPIEVSATINRCCLDELSADADRRMAEVRRISSTEDLGRGRG